MNKIIFAIVISGFLLFFYFNQSEKFTLTETKGRRWIIRMNEKTGEAWIFVESEYKWIPISEISQEDQEVKEKKPSKINREIVKKYQPEDFKKPSKELTLEDFE